MDLPTCAACGATNRPEARFCWSCGAALARVCPQCQAANRPLAQFCSRCGSRLVLASAAPEALAGHEVKSGPAASPGAAAPLLLRLLEAGAYPGFGWSREKQAMAPVRRFSAEDTGFHIRLRLANLEPRRPHSHRLFVQFFRPNGRLHLSRERAELVVAAAGQTEVEASIFGLRLSGAEAVNYPGMWRAVVYLDEARLVEISFEIEG